MKYFSKERIILRAIVIFLFLLIWFCNLEGILPGNSYTILTILLFGIFWFIEAKFIKPARTDQNAPRRPRL